MYKRYQGFTLIELMVAMAIMATLMGMSLFGISIVNQLSRDNQRRAAVNDIFSAISLYQSLNNEYPESIEVSANQVEVGETVVPLNGVAEAGNSTNSTESAYCYERTVGGYKLGVLLESGGFFDQGVGNTACTEADIITPGL